MSLDLQALLQRYINQPADTNASQANADFDQVASSVSRQKVAQGVTETLRSDQTPPFAKLVSQMFAQGNAEQKAGMINQLVAGLHPELWSSIAGGILANLFRQNGGHAMITPDQTAQLTQEQVEEIAAGAERQIPAIIDKMGEFYAQHSGLIKTLGGTAVAIALSRIARPDSQTTSSQATSSQTANPQATNPQTVNPQTVNPQPNSQ